MSALAYDTTATDDGRPVTTDSYPSSPESRLIDERVRYARASGSIVTFRETLTPALAAALLERNSGNRKLSNGHAETIAEAIKRGEWRETHQAIAVASDGALVDGQHRCEAVILAGTPVAVLISFGVSPDAFAVIDTGKNRRAHDILSVGGADNSQQVAAVARFLCLLDDAPSHAAVASIFTGRRGLVSNARIVAKASSDPYILPAISLFNSIRAEFKFAGIGLACGLACIMRAGANDADVANFVSKIGSGLGLENEKDPVFLLRQIMTNRTVLKKRVHVYENAAWTIKAWNLTRTGRRIGYLGLKSAEDFPVALP